MAKKTKQIELRSEQVQDILDRMPHWMVLWGNSIILGGVVLLLALSWIVKYPDLVGGNALVTTKNPPQKVYAAITGRITDLMVQNNQGVEKHEPLAVLENTANYRDVFRLQKTLDTVSYSNQLFVFPIEAFSSLQLGDIELAYALFEQNYISYRLNNELKPLANEVTADKNTLHSLQERRAALRTQRNLSKKELDYKQKDFERHKVLFDKGVISEQEFENVQLELLNAQRNLKNLGIQLSQTQEGISLAQKSFETTNFSRTKGEIQMLQNTIRSFNQLKKAVKDWEYKYVLKSEIAGTVSFLNIWSKNQTVSQQDLVFTIVPEHLSDFLAKVKIPIRNSGKIKVGQQVQIKLENYPETEFGTLKGVVNNISLSTDSSGFYWVDVALPNQLRTSYGKEIQFRQEMEGTAEIITDDLRLLERFFYQFRELINR